MMAHRKGPMLCFLHNFPLDTLTWCCCFGPAILFPAQGLCTCCPLSGKLSFPYTSIPHLISPWQSPHFIWVSVYMSSPSLLPLLLKYHLLCHPFPQLDLFFFKHFLQGYVFYLFYYHFIRLECKFHEGWNFVSFITTSLALTTVSGTQQVLKIFIEWRQKYK